MPVKVLIVDDEQDLLDLLSINLEREGFSVTTAASAEAALKRISAGHPDIILMDIMLPDVPGTRLTNQLKNNSETAAIPIILLTARDTETDMVVGLSMGADDYVVKPFSTAVLKARIEAVLRRSAHAPQSGMFVCGPVKLSAAGHSVLVDDSPVELTLAEFKILESLMRSQGTVLSRAKLMEEFAADTSVTERTIDVHIASLRKKLGPARDLIKTIHRLGYRMGL
jgi:DNA-binding response OmpR family regulator